jgi:hypothetical protein
MKRAILVLVSSLVLVAAVAAPAGAATPRLTAWWPLSENNGLTAHDLSGNHNDGTLSGRAQWTGGYFASGLTFDGSTGGVTVSDSASLEPAAAVTVAAYVKASGSPGNYKAIVTKGANACNAGSYALYTGANGGLQFYIGQNGGLTFTVSPDAGTNVWDGNWHWVVGTYDGNALHLYVDGSEVGTGTALTGPLSYGLPNGNDLYIGHYDACNGQNLDYGGSIDEPTVFNGALNASQVRIGYAALSLLHRFVSRLPAWPSM